MTIFTENGHVTRQGFDALLSLRLNERELEQLSEHLSRCEICSQRLADTAEATALAAPPPALGAHIRERLPSAAQCRKLEFRRYCTRVAVCAAASIAIVLSGVTELLPTPALQTNITAPAPNTVQFSIPSPDELDSSEPSPTFKDIWQSVNNYFSQLKEDSADDNAKK